MTHVERVMCIRLGVLDHHTLIVWFTPPKVRVGGENFIHNLTGIFGCLEIKI